MFFSSVEGRVRMDMWVVAAAAGAGYLAKYWQNSRDRDSLPKSSSESSDFEKPESPLLSPQLHNMSCPFRRLARRKTLCGDVSTEGEKVSDASLSEMSQSDGASMSEVASTSGFVGENLVNLGKDGCNLLSISSFPPGLLRNENLQENADGSTGNGDNSGDLFSEPPIRELGSLHGSFKTKSSLRSEWSHGHFVRPLSSLESCLMAQLYKEHAKMGEYVLSSLSLPSSPTVRPLLVTDRSQLLGQASGDYFSTQIGMEKQKLHKEIYSKENETVFGIPALPTIGSTILPRKVKLRTRKGWVGRLGSSSTMVNRKHVHSQGGSGNVTLLFCLGFSIGIISSVIANKREVDKLKELLKQTENLVQDLQEELEMKDLLTVKELSHENYESQGTHDHSFHNMVSDELTPPQDMDKLITYDAKEPHDRNIEENSTPISKIEAELEAELERLEVSLNSSSLNRALPNRIEIDPDFEAEFVQGELRTDTISGRAAGLPDSNQDTSSTSTTHSAHYAVSPRELSLRLHEVVQSRLEERIKELEAALENSQRKMHLMESECKNSRSDFSYRELGSSSARESPISTEKCKPLVMNLSEEALASYNEAHKELMKINESGQEDLPNCTIIPLKVRTTLSKGQMSRVQRLDNVGLSGDEISDCDDEMEKLLIKQIVEKTKKGSPVFLNAQRALFSVDENEQ